MDLIRSPMDPKKPLVVRQRSRMELKASYELDKFVTTGSHTSWELKTHKKLLRV